MGQKVNPIGLRLGIVKDWDAKWYAEKEYSQFLHEDIKIRNYIKKKLYHAGISKTLIERAANQVRITVYSARPGIVIGRKGSEVEKLRQEIQNMIDRKVQVNVQEVPKPETDATLVAENVASQLERRASYRRAMKQAITRALREGTEGIKIMVSGRLGGAEMANTEWYLEGRLPLHTLRADIDYASVAAHTNSGVVGVKVWIFKGEILKEPSSAEEKTTIEEDQAEETILTK